MQAYADTVINIVESPGFNALEASSGEIVHFQAEPFVSANYAGLSRIAGIEPNGGIIGCITAGQNGVRLSNGRHVEAEDGLCST